MCTRTCAHMRTDLCVAPLEAAVDVRRRRALHRPAHRHLLGGEPCRRGPTLETRMCRHHTSGPPPYHSMTGESATSISSKPAQPARRMISAKPRRLDAAPTGSPSTRTWRPSPLTGGQTVTERSVIRQASPATARRASGRSTRCCVGRRATAGGVQVRLDTHHRCPGREAPSVSRACSSTPTAW